MRIGCFGLFLILTMIVVSFIAGSVLLGGQPPIHTERVGVISVKGFLASSTETVEALRAFAADELVKAIVLEVVTPGGVVAPTQEIHDAVKAAAAKKPVVCAFGAVAASGGYYLSAPATKIVANPGSVTGSIGVILQFQEYHVLLDKLGLRSNAVKSGPYKDSGSPLREMNDAERAIMQALVDDIFDQFVDAVAKGRNMPKAKVLELADGRIYSGRQAKALGLVDELGGFWDAVALAGQLGEIEGEPAIERWGSRRWDLLHYLVGEEADMALDAVAPLAAPPIRYVLPSW